MELRGIGTGWLCIAVVCSGAALVLKEKEPGRPSATQRDNVPEPTGDPTTTARDVDKLPTRPTVTQPPLWTRDPITTPVPTRAGAAGNKTQNASAVPIREPGPSRLCQQLFRFGSPGPRPHPGHHPNNPRSPERKRPEKSSAVEHTETTFCEPDPPRPQLLLPQPDTPAAAGGPCCSGEPGAD
ncbi:uncharacterized protein [Ciconia boyciana]|uniref:uncharacterized protein isoform X2 n=1 Tax=Ciconia boyciana TaxID=52775 RepID=UPI003B9FDC3E